MNREQAKEKIKKDVPCTDYLEKSKGNMYCCPYCGSGHGQSGTGAVKYYPETNSWTCHACNKSGDVIDLYAAQRGCDFNTALSDLSAELGIAIDTAQEGTGKPQSDSNGKKVKQPINKTKAAKKGEKDAENTETTPADFTAYYTECLKRIDDPAAVSYLVGRGISVDTAKTCSIGYDPQADPSNAPGAMGNEYKPHPTPRLIIPCSTSHYVARSIDPATDKAYKALNPNQQKGGGRVALFNDWLLQEKSKVIFITEGVFDALSFLEAGKLAIALNSKGNGKLLLQSLQGKQTETEFIICHDNDSDPKTAADTMKRAEELNESLRTMGYNSIVYNVAGQYHDANDALQADRALFESNIAAAINELHGDDLTDFFEKITTDAYKPHRTGLNFFDELLDGGIINQSLILLLAAPAAGKTTLAQQIAETMAVNKKPVIYFNFEMSREQMLAKAISAKGYRGRGINKSTAEILQGYDWKPEERAQIESVIEEYRRENYPYIKYNPAGTSSDLNSVMEYLTATGQGAKAAGKDAPAVVVDYLHLLTSSESIDPQELIKQAVTGLKKYAMDYNTFVIAIVAVNRESMRKGQLTMSSGRDSSNIEYTGDYQLSLNYTAIEDNKADPQKPQEMAELQMKPKREMRLRVLKNRFGVQGKAANVTFDAKHNLFYGMYDDFVPVDDAPAFEEEPQVIMTI